MANLIALIIFGGSFIGLFYLIARKFSTLINLPERSANEEFSLVKGPTKQGILQKTDLIKQVILRNRGIGAMGAVMVKTTGKFKTILTSHMRTAGDLEKVERIHREGDYWQKVEERKLPNKKKVSKKPKVEIIESNATDYNSRRKSGKSPAKKTKSKKEKI